MRYYKKAKRVYPNTRSKNPIKPRKHRHNTRLNKQPFLTPLGTIKLRKKIPRQWISATQTYNYMLKDTLVDWLKLYTRKTPKRRIKSQYHNTNTLKPSQTFNDFIMEKGVEFEDNIIKYINTHKIPVISVSPHITTKTVKKTIDLMKAGVPLIHSAPIKNKKNNTKGVIDLLIRSDYMDKLVNNNPLPINEQTKYSPKLGTNYYYIVIDIKFSTLPLRADGIHLLNSGSYPAYKSQTWIYTQAIGEIQGYTSDYAFILGRRWKYTSKNIKYKNYNCMDKLGTINFKTVDSEYKLKTDNALEWIKDVHKNGSKWSVSPPSRPELFPNMCKDSGKWQQEKEKIANDIGEITSIWYCGVKHRDHAINRKITSWKDPNCNSENMNMKIGGVRAPIINKILNINRQEDILIQPNKIKTNIYNWKNTRNEIYVDFETITDIFSPFSELPEQKSTDMIFMIGIWWKNRGNWEYKRFLCNEGTYEEEYRIMNDFNIFLKQQKYPIMWYWYAENKIWSKAENRQFDITTDKETKKNILSWNISSKWKDICKIFTTEPIVIKDCFKFGLKQIASAMKKHGMINTEMDSTCTSGMTACIEAWKVYNTNTNPNDSLIMKDIEKYNQFDVEVLYDIMTYLRKYHT